MLRQPRVRSPDCGYSNRVLVIDAVLRFKIVGIGRRPMLIQCRTDLLISRSRILLVRWSILLLLIVHLEPQTLRQEGPARPAPTMIASSVVVINVPNSTHWAGHAGRIKWVFEAD